MISHRPLVRYGRFRETTEPPQGLLTRRMDAIEYR
jgi:hypothetical protein